MVLKPLGLLAATLIAAPVAATEATAVARKQALMQQYVAASRRRCSGDGQRTDSANTPHQYRTRRTCSEQTAKFFGLNTSVDPVDGQRTSTEYLVGKYSGMFEPVDCHDWKAFVFCINGDCQLAFNSGRYGLHPTACSKARIDEAKCSGGAERSPITSVDRCGQRCVMALKSRSTLRLGQQGGAVCPEAR